MERENRITRMAKEVKDTADTAFDSIQQGIENVESGAMNTVDRTAAAINRMVEDEEVEEEEF